MFAAGRSGRPFPVPTKGTFVAALGQAVRNFRTQEQRCLGSTL
jgi:hypothetical protein